MGLVKNSPILALAVLFLPTVTNGFGEGRFYEYRNTTAVRCGTLIQDQTSYINYKPSEQAVANERCVWIIATQNATGFELQVKLGFQPDQRLLVIGAIVRGKEMEQIFPSTVESRFTVRANVLVITYYTKADVNGIQGFSLTAVKQENPSAIQSNPGSRFQIYDSDSQLTRHPATRCNPYYSRELSVFSFVPTNNLFANREREVLFNEIGLEDSCHDFLHMYKFTVSLGRWELWGLLCNRVGPASMTSNDMVLAVFHSDTSANFAGFYLASRDLTYGAC